MTQLVDEPAPASVARAGSLREAPYVAAALAIVVLDGCCLWLAGHVHAGHVLHELALFVHLASLVIGFGAVLTVDWLATLWVLRRRTLTDVLHAAHNVHVPIWAGYAGLVLSGVLLEPELSNPLTQVKLVLVLVIGWNGLLATALAHHLRGLPTRALLVVSCVSAGVSQTGWWGAMAIGFVNSR